jgi:hypothetical protein
VSADAKLNEWNLLLDQFHALVREGSDSTGDIFDLQFRRRFSKLIDQVAGAAWAAIFVRCCTLAVRLLWLHCGSSTGKLFMPLGSATEMPVTGAT